MSHQTIHLALTLVILVVMIGGVLAAVYYATRRNRKQ